MQRETLSRWAIEIFIFYSIAFNRFYSYYLVLSIKSRSFLSFYIQWIFKNVISYFKSYILFYFYLAVAGNWGTWLPWSPCSETCGKGMHSRVRLCNNPPPAFDGPHCEGTDTQTQVCKDRPCPGQCQKP